MTHTSHIASLLLTLLLLSSSAQAQDNSSKVDGQTVAGLVKQVTATEVFIDMGSAQGIRAGDTIQISLAQGSIGVMVQNVWTAGARCQLAPDQPIPSPGASAKAMGRDIAPRRIRQGAHLAAPVSIENLSERWRDVPLRRSRTIAYVSDLASPVATDKGAAASTHGVFALEYNDSTNPLDPVDDAYRQIGLRSNIDSLGLLGGELDYSHRLRLRYDMGPSGSALRFGASRSELRVYRMRAAFALAGLDAEVGRMGAGPVPDAGYVDGITVRREMPSGFTLGAWAGAAPTLTGLRPSGVSLAFGAYAATERQLGPQQATRWNLSAGVIGSSWQGALDRSAFSMRSSLRHRKAWIDGLVVLDLKGQDRPALQPTSLSMAAGVTVLRKLRLHARFDQARSVRTLESKSLLPEGYLQSTAFSSARLGVDYRAMRGLHVSIHSGWRGLAQGSGSLWTRVSTRAYGLWLGEDSATLSVDGALGNYSDGASTRISYRLPVHADVDLRLGYRFFAYRYGSENERFYRHQPSIGLQGTLPWRLRGSLDTEAYLGAEQMVLTTFATASRRF